MRAEPSSVCAEAVVARRFFLGFPGGGGGGEAGGGGDAGGGGGGVGAGGLGGGGGGGGDVEEPRIDLRTIPVAGCKVTDLTVAPSGVT